MLQAVPKPIVSTDLGQRRNQEGDNNPYPIPTEDQFDEEDYRDAPDLYKIVLVLMDRHPEKFAHLSQVPFATLWKREGGKAHGKLLLGQVKKISGLAKFYGNVELVICLSADHLRVGKATYRVIEAVVAHEMAHVAWDAEKGKVYLVPHDFEGFSFELREYGTWRTDLKIASEAFQQIGLFGGK